MNKTLIKLLLWTLAFILSLIFLPQKNSSAEAPEMLPSEMRIEDMIVHYAHVYDVDTKIALAVARCESRYNPATIGDGGRAKGIWQYHNETWERHYKEFNQKTGITLTKGVPNDDTQLAVWAIANGKGNEWTAYRTIQNGGTYSFYSRLLKQHFTVQCKM